MPSIFFVLFKKIFFYFFNLFLFTFGKICKMIARLIYFLVLKPLSLLPLPILYLLSNVIYFILFKVVKYRKKVVYENMKKSFPEKSEIEINLLMSQFYSHLCDLTVESIRFFSISKDEAISRLNLENPEIFDEFFKNNQSGIVVSGHYNNWEITAIAFKPQINHEVAGFYTPLSNKFFEEKFSSTRGKFGCKLIPTKKVSEFFEINQNIPTLTLFGSDQSPSNISNVYWTKFLNQDTAVALGAERYAKKYNIPVIFANIKKVKRGYYSVKFEILFEKPQETKEFEITETFTRKIEEMIQNEPQYWLWTHKRWKHKKTNSIV